MRVVGGLLGLVGTAAVGAGLAFAVGGGAPVETLTTTVVGRLGNDYLLVAAVGGVAFALTVCVVAFRAVGGIDQVAPPDPEGIPSAPRLGAGFDRYVHRRASPRVARSTAEAEVVRDRLRAVAVQAVMDHQGCSRETARQSIEDGEWTEDVEAAAYLGGQRAPRPPRRARLRAALRGQRWRQRGARRTAMAIVERSTDRRS